MRKLQTIFITFLFIVTAVSWVPAPSFKTKRREVEPAGDMQRREPAPVPSYSYGKKRREPEPVPSYSYGKKRRDPEPVPSYSYDKKRRDPEPVPSYSYGKKRRDPEPAVPSYSKQRREPQPEPSYSKKRREVQQEVLFGVLNCAAGFTSCPISPLDPRHECVNMKDDLENCGTCGNICGKGKGERTSSCADGVCVISSCRPGYILNDGTCEII